MAEPVSINTVLSKIVKRWSAKGFLIATEKVKRNLSGKVLRIRSGRLIGSVDIISRIINTGFIVGTNVPYGIAWEKGWHRPKMFPVRARALKIPLPGQLGLPFDKSVTNFIFRKSVKAQTFPAKPWLKPAIDASHPQLIKLFETEGQPELAKAFPDFEINVPIIIGKR